MEVIEEFKEESHPVVIREDNFDSTSSPIQINKDSLANRDSYEDI